MINRKALGMTEEEATAFQDAAESVYDRWNGKASVDLRLTFAEIQSLAMRQILESGEFIAVRRSVDDRRRPYFLAFEPIEPDRLEDPVDVPKGANIRFGIEKDALNVPSAYYFLVNHPGDSMRTVVRGYDGSKRVAAYDSAGRPIVFHVYPVLRPGQSRGIPFFAPVLETFKTLADYMEAELVAARVAACFAAFVKTDNPYLNAYNRADDTNASSQRLEGMEPGAIEYLGPGQEITFSDPKRPGQTFDAFVERLVRSIGAALGLPYELIFKDFSKTSYSSARAALLQAYRVFQNWQQMIVEHLCQPAWEILLEEAFLRGQLPIADFYQYRFEYTRALWIPPGWSWVDPLKEAQANQVAIQTKVKSRAMVCAEQGVDWETVTNQLAREKALDRELGLDSDESEEAPGQDDSRGSENGETGRDD